jgi:transcriptional regulator with XRE-family HTH domain
LQLASLELLRALRGRRSQIAFARRIGYRGNPATQWERGLRHPTANEALRVAELTGVDVGGAFSRFTPLPRPKPDALHVWLNALRGSASIQDLAQRIGRSRHTLSRWLSGAGQPKLHELLQLIEICTGRVHDWVAELVPIESVPSLLPGFRQAAAARTLARDRPWTEAVLRVLETARYQARPTEVLPTLAACLGITDGELEAALRQLVQAGIVELRGNKYCVQRQLSVDSDRTSLRQLQAHWLGVARERTRGQESRDWFAYNVISVSEADLQRVHECLKRAFLESRAIVAASEPAETAALVLMHLVKWS